MITLCQTARGRLVLVALVAAVTVGLSAEAPRVYAIKGARLVTVAGPAIESGTVVLRDGLIEAVGAGVAVPADATVIDGTGLTVYPGLIDMGTPAGIEVPAIAPPKDPKTREEVERWKRQVLLRPQLEAAQCVKADPADLGKMAAAGVTSVLATPDGGAIAGRSSLLTTAIPGEAPQIGDIVGARAGQFVVRTPVFLHVRFPERPAGDGYPESLMGVIAFVRQAFLDAGYQQAQAARADKGAGAALPFEAALDALQPALAGRIPVAIDAQDAHEIRRALSFAREFGFDAVVSGGLEADLVADELKARKARVLLSLNYPTRPKALAPGADEPLSVLKARANAPAVAAALDRAGIPFAFQSNGLREPGDFLKNAARAVKAGLSREAAVKALTLGAAAMAGVAGRLGSIEKGKIANLVVVRGDLFDDGVAIRHVFVGGRPLTPSPAAPARPSRPTGQ